MWHIRRVHMESVGHPDARFDPLTVDLTDANGTPADTVMWLENMGGKTSWVSLLFSVLRPDRKDFLGSLRDDKQIEQYVLASDTSHIVVEWERLGPASLFPAAMPRLVTGQVLQWRDRRVDMENASSRLSQRWYGFAPTSEVDFDSLPIRNSDGHRRPLKEFVDVLNRSLEEADAQRPTANHSDWKAWLVGRGLDPEVFRYQLQMNADEGSVAEQFQWPDGNGFVRWALEYIVDPALPKSIADAVDAVRAQLARREPLELEDSFCHAAANSLDDVATSHELCGEAQRELESAWDNAATLARSLKAAAVASKTEAENVNERATTAAEDAKTASRRADHCGRQRAEALIVAADLRIEELVSKRRAVEIEQSAKKKIVDAWQVAELLVDDRRAEKRMEQIEIELKANADETAPLRNAADQAGARLARKLTALRERADKEKRRAGEAAARARELAQEAATRADSAEAEEGHAMREVAAASALLEQLDAALAKAVRDGLIKTTESASAAARRHAKAVQGLELRDQRIQEHIAELSKSVEDASGRVTTSSEKLRAATTTRELADDRVRRMDADRGELEGDPLLIEAAQQEPFDPWSSPAEVLGRLHSSAEVASQTSIQLELDLADDRRAIDYLERESILPPSPDVERALVELETAGIRTAFSGWQVLRDEHQPEKRGGWVQENPELANGILVHDEQELERAREVLGRWQSKLPLVVATHQAASSRVASDRLVLAGPAALHDEDAAAEEREDRQTRLVSVEQGIASERAAEKAARSSAVRYEAFLDTWSTATREEALRQKEEARELVVKATNAHDYRQRELAKLSSELAGEQELLGSVRSELTEAEKLKVLAERLAEEEERRAELTAKKGGAEKRQTDWATKKLRAKADAEAEGTRADNEERLAEQAEDRGQGIDAELRQQKLSPNYDGREPADPVDLLLTVYSEAVGALDAIRRDDVLESQREGLGEERSRLAVRISRFRDTAIDAARKLVEQSASKSEEQRDAERRAAEAQFEVATEAVGKIKDKLDAARSQRQEREKSSKDRAKLDANPTRSVDAEALATELEKEQSRLNEERGRYEKRRDELRIEAAELRKASKQFEDAASELAESLEGMQEKVGRKWAERLAATVDVWRGTDAEAAESRRAALGRLQRAGGATADALSVRQSALSELAKVVNKSEFAALLSGTPLRDRLLEDAEDVRARNAGSLAHELRRRAQTIERDLAEIAEHRKTLTTMLVGQVRTTLQLLRQLQNQSRLPQGLDDWSGRSYLVIKHADPPADPQQLSARVDTVIDEVCSAGARNRTDGLSLLYSGLRTGVGSDFNVEILKPHKTLRRVRVPVAEIRTFSGGQKITAALVLFAALTRMRELNLYRDEIRRGEVGAALVLDNPIGKASAGTLIEVQRRVAQRCGLQLLYTTGVADLGALGAFTCVVRLDGKENLRTGAQHVVPLERTVKGVRVVQRRERNRSSREAES